MFAIIVCGPGLSFWHVYRLILSDEKAIYFRTALTYTNKAQRKTKLNEEPLALHNQPLFSSQHHTATNFHMHEVDISLITRKPVSN